MPNSFLNIKIREWCKHQIAETTSKIFGRFFHLLIFISFKSVSPSLPFLLLLIVLPFRL